MALRVPEWDVCARVSPVAVRRSRSWCTGLARLQCQVLERMNNCRQRSLGWLGPQKSDQRGEPGIFQCGLLQITVYTQAPTHNHTQDSLFHSGFCVKLKVCAGEFFVSCILYARTANGPNAYSLHVTVRYAYDVRHPVSRSPPPLKKTLKTPRNERARFSPFRSTLLCMCDVAFVHCSLIIQDSSPHCSYLKAIEKCE